MISFYCINIEKAIGVIERKHIVNINSLKYNLIFVLEEFVRELGLFSPYKQLKRMYLKEITPNPDPNPIAKSSPIISTNLSSRIETSFNSVI
jgi:hypothetical protein